MVNLASGREVSVNRLVRAMLDVLGIRVPVVHEAPRPGDVRRHCGSIELARRLIGFEPRGAIEEGLAETLTWYRDFLASREAGHAH